MTTGLRPLALSALTALMLGWAPATQAMTVYYLDVDGCSGGCGLTDYGRVFVTQSTDLSAFSVDVELAPGVFFDRGDNGLDAVSFDVLGNPVLATTGVSNFFGALSPHTAQGVSEGPLGVFNYRVFWTNPGSPPGPLLSSLNFTISAGGGVMTLGSTSYNNTPLFFAVDIQHTVDGVVKSGVIGASLTPPPTSASAAPEPASWALMILGFGGVGAGLRARARRLA